jgi:sugar phosphate isomerase/epimerase
VLARHGQRIAELEALGGWSHGGSTGERSRAKAELAFHAADVFGASYLQAVAPYERSLDDAATSFAALCDRAAEHGLAVGLEFLPFTNIPDVAAARTLVEAAGRPNGGICVDSWHFFRGTPDWDALASLPGDRILDTQLNDGSLVAEHPDYLEDGLRNRRAPGDGQFDLRRFLDVLAATGTSAPISVEVISAELDLLPPVETARRVAEPTRALLEGVTWR